jgi:flavin-dependent dehydrogenase
MNFDVVIIGAGLAGLSACKAIVASGKLLVALVEGNSVGSNNPSPLTFPDVLEAHDLMECAKEKYSSFAFHNFRGSRIEHRFAGFPLIVLDYRRACLKIFSLVVNGENPIQFFPDYAEHVAEEPEGVCVTLKSGKKIQARCLIDASGKAQVVGHQAGNLIIPLYSHVYGAVFSQVDPRGLGCYFLMPNSSLGSGGGWFYSFEGGRASFGYAQISKDPYPDYKFLKEIFERARTEFEPYSTFLKNSRIELKETGTIPIAYAKKMAFRNILLVGDAAGMATNWTCMGVEVALNYGRLAGQSAVRAVTGQDQNALAEYAQRWLEDNQKQYDSMAKMGAQFWNSDFYFWEWIIKNDLAYLNPRQVVARLRSNAHLLSIPRALLRAARFRLGRIFNPACANPVNLLVSEEGRHSQAGGRDFSAQP